MFRLSLYDQDNLCEYVLNYSKFLHVQSCLDVGMLIAWEHPKLSGQWYAHSMGASRGVIT